MDSGRRYEVQPLLALLIHRSGEYNLPWSCYLVILFANKDLQALCSNERLLVKKHGKAGARKLRARLSDLEAASSITDLSVGRPHPLKGDRAGQLAISLDGGRRLVLEPANNPIPTNEDASVAWNKVTMVRVVFIGDYHD